MSAELSFICPGCRTRLKLSPTALGKAVRCPRCGFTFRARLKTPAGAATAAGSPAAASSAAAPAKVPASSTGIPATASVPAARAAVGSSTAIPSASASSSNSIPVVTPVTTASAPGLAPARPRPPAGSAGRLAAAKPPEEALSKKTDMFVGRQLGQYKIIARLGRGAKGIVYEAEDTLLGRRVAVKVLAPEVMAGGPTAVQRFLLEARAASKLDHPNCVGVYNIGKEDNTVFFSMPMIKGLSALDTLDKNGAFSPADATRVVRLAATGLHAAHGLGIIHRDVKPGNIMLGDNGEVKVADFGMAKVTDNAIAGLTEPGRWLGTPHYMSPEQCQGLGVDARSDVYSLGATYYCLLAGRPPFSDINPMAVVYKQVTDTHPDPRTVNPKIPGICVRIIDKAMSKNPEFRYQSAAEMAAALKLVEDSLRQNEAISREADGAASATGSSAGGWTGETEGLADSVLGTLLEDESDSGDDIAFDKTAAPPPAPAPAAPAPNSAVNGFLKLAGGMGGHGVNNGGGSAEGAAGLAPTASGAGNAFVPGATPSVSSSGKISALRPGASSEPQWMHVPANVSIKLRYPSVGEAKAGWRYLSRDIRANLDPAFAPSIYKGQKVGILEVSICQTPAELLRIIKTLICSGGEFLGLNAVDPQVADWLRRQVATVRTG
jgi:serine/threonine protein kinase/DNA-directed RNA polymerase subunit RPC12/RpoP